MTYLCWYGVHHGGLLTEIRRELAVVLVLVVVDAVVKV